MSDDSCSPSPVPARPLTPAKVTTQILSTAFFTFLVYLAIGIPMAVLPGYIHLDLGYSSVIAGLGISVQYFATFISRANAGRMIDTVGAKQTVMRGMLLCTASGGLLLLAALAQSLPFLSLMLLFASRALLGLGESLVGTGAIMWGIGRVGADNTAKMISWNGIATYAALAIGAPLGVMLDRSLGFAVIGLAGAALTATGYLLARGGPNVPVVLGEKLSFKLVLRRVFAYGLGLAFGTIGFGSIATFITLYYADHRWGNAAFALTAFSAAFVGARLLFANAINRFGGYRVAIVSFLTEAVGLLLLWVAGAPEVAMLGAALTGFGFALVFPSLGVEAVKLVPAANRGAALAAYSVFLDLALGFTGPLAGLIVGQLGYPQVFLFAAIAAIGAVALSLSLYRSAQQRNGQ
ncbi:MULTISPECIES: MFS transporter [unclassified Herbaspirillum]|uniref:MFS transporter n=1 Tax=unclassified Herbaspirillum TaxID=2624150 RepID=UPI00114D643E|nr:MULTISPECIES: MFS transporter [unclassified Herbaspirillum]MBB5392589.1 MFS family permease [Herbaspirillum sp. SJZ102]TQK06226.1 putative MFS family arabinose efflux permease [Herbaspirillum sp. SJZ130]TQK12296.1 putative MFS family arabinose efflux permease [Herbaspirillum sp. SJZ106]TWC68430.1 putative MFS family arabinose efflux permease [Herbaspirillum sp. SJZ099]